MVSRRELIAAGVAGSLSPTFSSDGSTSLTTSGSTSLTTSGSTSRAGSGSTALTTGGGREPVVAEQSADREGQREIAREIARAIGNVQSAISRAALSNEVIFGVGPIRLREQFVQFFKTNAKFPDFVDIGVAVFMDVYDWHIKNRQQLVVTRGTDGRYSMQFMFTTLLVRAEYDNNYIGIPYDKA